MILFYESIENLLKKRAFLGFLMMLSLALYSSKTYAAGYSSSSVSQATGNVLPGAANQQVITVRVEGSSSGFLQNWQISSCSFTLNNTNNANVTAARLWMNSSNSFGGATQVGATAINPSGTINFTISSGGIGDNDRYLFLTFDIAADAPCSGNFIDAFVPSGGLVTTGNNSGNKTPSPNNPAGNRQIFNQVVPSVSIVAPSGSSGCEGTPVELTATPVNGGVSPSYQWKVDGVNQGANSSTFTISALSNNAIVTCEMTSHAECATPLSVISNQVDVSIYGIPRPRIFPSDTVVCTGSFFTIVARDTGMYSTGYPAGTLFDFGFGPSPDSTFFVNGPGVFVATVLLPPGYASCSGISNSPNLFYVDAPVPILEASTVSCNGELNGRVTAQVYLGNSPYHFRWYNNGNLLRDTIRYDDFDTLQNIGAGTYFLVVSDSISETLSNLVCTSDSASIEVTQPQVLTINAVKNDVSCQGGNDGAINITVSGGTGPYQYAWSNSEISEDISLLLPGSYTVTVTDVNGCFTSHEVTISTTVDIIPPFLNCPANITVSAAAGQCEALVSYITPFGTDNCPGVVTVQTAGLPSGSLFPLGNTIVSYQATDSVGNETTCSFIVTVTDDEAPVITCPADIAVNNAAGSCNAEVPYLVPLASDNCGTVSVIQIAGLAPGSLFPAGTTVNTFRATDGAGNISTCSFNVIVSDVALPVITCTPDTTIVNNAGLCGSEFTYSINYTDNCSAIIVQNAGLPSGSVFPVGTTVNTFTATDPAGNSASCSFSVTVADTEVPVALAQDISLLLDQDGTLFLHPMMIGSGSSDNCGIATRTVSPSSFSCSDVGDNVVVLTVTDIHGNFSSDTAIVTVSSSISTSISPDPIGVCLGNSVDLAGNAEGGSGNYSTHLWNGPGGMISDITSDSPGFTGLSTGTYTITYTVTDDNGCIASDEVEVEVFESLGASVGGTNVSCNSGNDGTATVTLTGGSGEVTFLWSNGSTLATVTGLTAGTYTVTVSDVADCFVQLNIGITEPGLLVLGTTTTNSGCGGVHDGTASAIPSGGTPPYSYLWSDGQTTQVASGLAPGDYTVTATDALGCIMTGSATVTPLTITITLSSPLYNGGFNVSCAGGNNGIANLTVENGLGPFSYSWSNGSTTEDIGDISAGTYTVSVTNGVCTSTGQITLTEPMQVSPVATGTDVTCFNAKNGTAAVVASGGVGGYTYLWNTVPAKTTESVIKLVPGTYNVMVTDANGCQNSTTVTITQPAAITTSGVITNLKCKGDANGAINITASGGIPSYTYFWNGGIISEDRIGLKAKAYTVTVTDANGCTKKAVFTVSEPAAKLQLFTNKTNVRCHNGKTGIAGVSATGGQAPYAYSWNTIPVKTTASISGIAAGTYTCTVTDAFGCIKTAVINITQPPLLVLTTSQSNVTVNGGTDGTASVSASGGSPGYSYLWNTVPPKTTASITGLAAGVYSVKVTDSKGCSKNAVVTITQPSPRVQQPERYPEAGIKVFPNPSNGFVSVQVANYRGTHLTVALYDILGNLVYEKPVQTPAGTDFDFRSFPKGIYMMELKGEGLRKVTRLVIQ